MEFLSHHLKNVAALPLATARIALRVLSSFLYWREATVKAAALRFFL